MKLAIAISYLVILITDCHSEFNPQVSNQNSCICSNELIRSGDVSTGQLSTCELKHCSPLPASTPIDRCLLASGGQMNRADYTNDDVFSDADTTTLKIVPLPVSISRRSDSNHLIAVCNDGDAGATPAIKYCTSTACYSMELTGHLLLAHRQLPGSRKCIRQRCSSTGDEGAIGGLAVDSGCVAKHCCRDLSTVEDQADTTSGLQLVLSRKRRVNDDVSQCIQSYCSGKLFRERILCILKNCNRSA